VRPSSLPHDLCACSRAPKIKRDTEVVMKATVSDQDRELTKMKAYKVAAEEMGVRQRVVAAFGGDVGAATADVYFHCR